MAKKLIEFYPNFLKDIREFRVLSSALQEEVDFMQEEVKKSIDNHFIDTAGSAAIKKWEKFLGIKSSDNEPLKDRKTKILLKVNENLPYTEVELRARLEELVGDDYDLIVKYSEYTIFLRIAMSSKPLYAEVIKFVRYFIPANMALDMSLLYNKHLDLKKYRHVDLKPFAHMQIREKEGA